MGNRMRVWAATAPVALVALAFGQGVTPAFAAPQAVHRPFSAAPAPATSKVIVVLADQFGGMLSTAAKRTERSGAVRADQAPVVASLQASGAKEIRSIQLVNAVVATVSPAEQAALSRDPAVSEVVPDVQFRGPQPVVVPKAGGQGAAATPVAGVCPAKGKTQLNPEGLLAVNADSDQPGAKTARSLGYTGKGVTVGDIAVGIDVDEPELIRPNGQHVIKSHVDFTGDGWNAANMSDDETYLDDSVIAAQGNGTYDLSQFGAVPKGCTIKIEGVAPGVTLDNYKVYGQNSMTTTSAFLEAIDYAVDTDHVNVLNEEGGTFPFPDTAADLIKQANSAAMAAGVTVTSPSYDAGLESTIWSPSSQPGVISVGASTVFRSYLQTGEVPTGTTGWVSDNISSLSSGGFTQQGRSVDVVAPGDLDWIACVKTAPVCAGKDIQQSGGTSESGPIVAAVAALVIQAYRGSHHGATPSAALVRRIISGTATDLHAPGDQQGAGLVDAYRAVLAARSVRTPDGSPTAYGASLISDTQQLDAVGNTGGTAVQHFTLTNTGSRTSTVRLATRTLQAPVTLLQRTVTLPDDSPVVLHFRVRPGTDRLDADLASTSTTPEISLLDARGRMIAYSLPQGAGNHGHVDVHDPDAGTWTAVVSAPGGTAVHVGITASRFAASGTVRPARAALAPGASATFTVRSPLPSEPGDRSDSVSYVATGGVTGSVPVNLRSRVPIVGGVGRFATTMYGGNGRAQVPAQTFYYEFAVPAGEPALDVQTMLGDGATDNYSTMLVAPDGQSVAQAANSLLVGGHQTKPGSATHLHAMHPAAGTWTLIATFTNPVTGNRLATPFTGRIDFRPIRAVASGLPDGRFLRPGQQVPVAITVHNATSAPEAYFLDARLPQSVATRLVSISPSTNLHLPLSATAAEPEWLVPTHTTALVGRSHGSMPTTFDLGPFTGEPDLAPTVSGNDAVASWTAAQVTQGAWAMVPQPLGPFGGGAAKSSTATLSLTATTRAFDPGFAAPTGDLWRQSASAQAAFAPVVVQPGETVTIHAMLTAHGQGGTTVHGTLYLDDADALFTGVESPSGNELAALPYSYTVGAEHPVRPIRPLHR
ncbi:S8 family serine peptidase [Flexivirga caeni]|uniref:Peptidase S8/S53 domain-containing protein n=1 Tax=Flexivirga caeni TaxID=2294115 RepID=A0A3M9ME89_9MICO|nr:S8 family serine peptidase [Flexivirga caeni]RNI23869.1 hypothetical protein EFY87_06260 [Flexivirga caeni]